MEAIAWHKKEMLETKSIVVEMNNNLIRLIERLDTSEERISQLANWH